MATCKDCIHGVICNVLTSPNSQYEENAEKWCCNFKNKADYAEVKHGEWILTKTEHGWNCCEYPAEYTCSVCGRTETQEEPYCHCGAKMDGGNDGKSI